MDLKSLLSTKGKDNEKEYFWSLVIEPGWVQAGIWRIEGEKSQIMLSSPPFSWEVDEDLVQAVDNALSSAIQGFPEDLKEPTKTVFGVPSNWVGGGQIKGDHLEKIKILCSELTLTPIGFVVIPEAIAHLTKSEEGTPLNAIVLGVYKESLEITLFRLGNLGGSSQVARSVSIIDDVSEGLARFGEGDTLPYRILIYDGREGELEEVRQALLKVNWEDFGNLKFLHTPKIELVDTQKKVYAVCLAGASELANVTSIEVVKESDEKEEGKELGSFDKFLPAEESSPEELGFVVGKDIAQEKNIASDEATVQSVNIPGEENISEMHENVGPVVEKTKGELLSFTKSPLKFLDSIKTGVLSIGTWLKSTKSQIGMPGQRKSAVKQTFTFGFGFLVLFLLLGFLFWWFYPKAEVSIYVSPQKLEEKFDIKVDTKVDASDTSQKVLKGEILEATVSGDKTKNATGTKTVGDKAKGEVTLYRVGTELKLSSGTILYGPEGLKFSLDKEVTIASGSAGSVGTTKTSVIAEDIGAQYNLAGGTTFGVGNYSSSDLEAKNESSFSGGSSREITAVSSDDQKVLEEDLKEELVQKIKEEFLKKISAEKLILEESLAATPSSRNFSNKVGDEAETLKLSLELEANAVSLNKSELVQLAEEVLKDKIPRGFVLRGEQIEFDFILDGEEKRVYDFEVRVVANLLPEVKSEEIVKKIRGKYPKLAEEYLNQDVAGFVRAEIRIRPILPGKLKTLPHVAKNIEIEVAAER